MKKKILRSDRGRKFYTFSGIPYAKPPLGRRRFKVPEKADGGEGTLDATKWKKCLQSSKWMGREEMAGEEDCLVLNVHTDQVRVTDKTFEITRSK